MRRFRDDYERYKAKPIAEQASRVTNVMFSVFAFWNFVLQPDAVHGLSRIAVSAPIYTGVALLAGMFAGLYLLIRVGSMVHLLLLPLSAALFAATSPHEASNWLLMIPLLALLVLVLVRLVTRAGNAVNRW